MCDDQLGSGKHGMIGEDGKKAMEKRFVVIFLRGTFLFPSQSHTKTRCCFCSAPGFSGAKHFYGVKNTVL